VKNPLSDLSGTEIALIAAGATAVGTVIYLIWNASQQAAQLSAQASGASASAPGVPVTTVPGTPGIPTSAQSFASPLATIVPTIGLASGYYWENQNNTTNIPFGSSVEAIAMSQDDVASAVYGSTISAAGSATVTFLVSSFQDPASGLFLAQEITLPLSFVVPA